MEIKDLIKKRREELGLTYEALGNLVGVGKSTVRKWETGMIENMRRDNIIALSKALNISPSILMGWEEYKEETTSNYNNENEYYLDDPEFDNFSESTKDIVYKIQFLSEKDQELLKLMIDKMYDDEIKKGD